MNSKNLKIAIVGIGGGVQNAIDSLYLKNKSENIKFALINSDKNFLEKAKTESKLLIHGDNEKFYGLSCAGDAKTGKQYAEFCIKKIENLFLDADTAILVSCFGGGCGTGATPVITEMLKNKGIKTIAIISKPFEFEGLLREERADIAIKKMEQIVDKLIITNYQNLLETFPKGTKLREAWVYADELISNLLLDEIKEA